MLNKLLCFLGANFGLLSIIKYVHRGNHARGKKNGNERENSEGPGKWSDSKYASIQSFLDSYTYTHILPGALLQVVHDQDGDYTESNWTSNSNSNACYSASSMFRIYSMTKPVVTIAILQLVRRG